MTKDEITNYVQTSSRGVICVHREQSPGAELIVKSVYITGKPDAFVVSLEFDPITLVEEGEGWIWHSKAKPLDEVIALLEKGLKLSLADWENVTKTGRLLHDHYDLDLTNYKKDEDKFKTVHQFGEVFLYEGFEWLNKN